MAGTPRKRLKGPVERPTSAYRTLRPLDRRIPWITVYKGAQCSFVLATCLHLITWHRLVHARRCGRGTAGRMRPLGTPQAGEHALMICVGIVLLH